MRKLVPLIVVLGLMTIWPQPQPVVGGSALAIFPLSIKGKTYQPAVSFGGKAPSGKLNDKAIAAVLQSPVKNDFAWDFLNRDPSGRFFVYFDGRNANNGTGVFRIATNPNGVNTTTMNASITPEGLFWAVGKYTLPIIGEDADIFMTGKITFVKGTFTPKKITGTFNFMFIGTGMLAPTNETFSMKFKTLPPVI